MDNLTPEQRRKNMQAIRSKNTTIEIKLRKALWSLGYRYRVHNTKLPGKPDIVFGSKKVAIFCDSE
jgi:DNA mismatch endonuclease (patch repair protein)